MKRLFLALALLALLALPAAANAQTMAYGGGVGGRAYDGRYAGSYSPYAPNSGTFGFTYGYNAGFGHDSRYGRPVYASPAPGYSVVRPGVYLHSPGPVIRRLPPLANAAPYRYFRGLKKR